MSQNDPFARKPRIVDSQDISDTLEQDLLGFDNSIPQPHSISQIPPIPPKLRNLRSNPNFEEEKVDKSPKQKQPTSSTIITTLPTTTSTTTSSTTDTTPSATSTVPLCDQNNITMATITLVLPLLPVMTDDISQFISQCDILVGMLANQADKNLLTSFIRVKLQSKAQKLVEGAAATTWEEVKPLLQSLIKSVRPVEDVQAELSTRTQKPNESVEKYGEDMTRLLTELHKAFERELAPNEVFSPSLKTIIQRQAVRAFESGLRHEQLRLMVIMSKSTTLAAAINCATNLEGRLPKKQSTNQTTSSQPSSPNVSSNTSTNPSNKPICTNCKKTGHSAQHCYQKPIKSEPLDQNGDIFCRYCKSNTHLISDCETRKANNLRYRGNENYAPPRQVNLVEVPQPSSSTETQNQGNGRVRAGIEEIPVRIVDLPEN